jgi:hypothetical protein
LLIALPLLDAVVDRLLSRVQRRRRAARGALLAELAEMLHAEGDGRDLGQRQVGGDDGQPHARTELRRHQQAESAQFPQARVNSDGHTQHTVVAVDVGASLEFRLTRRWLVAGSVDPLRSCEALTTQLPTRYQFGLDLFWETRY